MILQYFTDQTMTQKIQNTDMDVQLIIQHLKGCVRYISVGCL